MQKLMTVDRCNFVKSAIGRNPLRSGEVLWHFRNAHPTGAVSATRFAQENPHFDQAATTNDSFVTRLERQAAAARRPQAARRRPRACGLGNTTRDAHIETPAWNHRLVDVCRAAHARTARPSGTGCDVPLV